MDSPYVKLQSCMCHRAEDLKLDRRAGAQQHADESRMRETIVKHVKRLFRERKHASPITSLR